MLRVNRVVSLVVSCGLFCGAGCKGGDRSDGSEAAAAGSAAAGAAAAGSAAAGSAAPAGSAAAAPAAGSASAPKVAGAAAGAAAAPGAAAPGAGAPGAAAAPAESEKAAADPFARMFPGRRVRNETLSDKMQRRIRFQLRELTKAPIALRDIIHVPLADGGAEVHAIYEYSVYEDCVKQYESREEARANCLEEPVSVVTGTNPDHHDDEDHTDRYLYKQVRVNRNCRRYGAVYAVFGPAPAGKPVTDGGALRVVSLALPKIDCEIQKISQFFVDDVDGDRRPEVYLELTTVRPEVVNRRGSYTDDIDVEELVTKQHVHVLNVGEQELEVQLEMSEVQVRVGDLNRDGHRDVVAIGACLVDLAEGAMGWPVEPDCPDEMRARGWYLYEVESDRWVLDGPPPGPVDPDGEGAEEAP